ncbi:MAG: NUDIX hydrolase [Planctomycetota bacterium]|nr:NUDIX hydrolase [Planctomycetota bacterium]
MAEGRFVAYKFLKWTDAHGVERVWEAAERLGYGAAVLVIPRLVPSGRLLLIRQFRPPARGQVIEFPAGIVDGGETPEDAARRELAEETGYVVRSLSGGLPGFTTPGLSNEFVHFFHAEIDENDPRNKTPETRFDPSEEIETLFVRPEDLMDFCRQQHGIGVHLDAKVLAYASAIALAPPGAASF